MCVCVYVCRQPDTGGSALVIYDYLDGLPADGRDPGDPGDPSDPTDPALGSGDDPHPSPHLAQHGESAAAAGAGRVEEEGTNDPMLAPDEREALRRERAESRLESRRRPEPALLRLPRHHQHVQHHHQQQHHNEQHHAHQHDHQDDISHNDQQHHNHQDHHQGQHLKDDDDEPHQHFISGDQPDLLVPLPPDSDPEQDPDGGQDHGLLEMECDGDEALLPLDSGQEGLFEREAALSDIDSDDGVDGHAIILADGGQYRLSETDEEENEGLEVAAGHQLQQEAAEGEGDGDDRLLRVVLSVGGVYRMLRIAKSLQLNGSLWSVISDDPWYIILVYFAL